MAVSATWSMGTRVNQFDGESYAKQAQLRFFELYETEKSVE